MGVLKGITAEAEDEDMKDITAFTGFLTLYDLPWNGDLDLGTLRWTFEMFQVLFGF
jgi:hypothetical protein